MDFSRRWFLVIVVSFQLWSSYSTAVKTLKRRHRLEHNHKHKDARWDRWSPWSPCSSDCGPGLSERSRLCRSTSTGLVVEGCHGVSTQLKLCKNTGCIRSDENSEACKDLDNISYGGRRYTWEPYKHPIKKCELACRPIGYTFYQGVGRNATNGTSCDSDGSVCVNGECKAVGCDEIVDSNATVDRCGVCGGDGMSCKTVIKTFTDSVKFGYKTIGTIPAGSSNIKITEIEESRNYIALKAVDGSFKLNTDWRLSRFGDHSGAGALFTYNRNKGTDCPGECITADGPTNVDLEVVGLFYTKKSGIRYSFTVPADSPNIVLDDETDGYEGPIFSHDFTFRSRKNGHKNNGHHKHNKQNNRNRHKNRNELKETNNYGTRSREETEQVITASGENEESNKDTIIDSQKVNKTDDKDTNATIGIGELKSKENRDEPAIAEDDFEGGVYLNEAMAKESGEVSSEDIDSDEHRDTVADDMYTGANTIPSPYSWRIRGYTQCSTSCGEGKHSQIIECIVTDKAIAVAEQYCADEPKPKSQVKPCSYGPCPPKWQPRPWSKCSVTCGSGSQRRNFVCTTSDGKEVSRLECSSPQPRSEERACDVGSCNMGWYHTQWPDECPVSCGDGVMTRKVYCASGFSNPAEVCPKRNKPQTEKRCKGEDCGASWFTGPWSECNATCGVAYQNRVVVCVLSQRRGRTMLVGDNYCTGEEKPSTYMSCDLEPCGPEWYMNGWGRCSASCGDGQKSRDVKCLDKNKRPSAGCDPASMPRERESCNKRKCPQTGPGRPEPTDSDCADKFSSCNMVIQARLCQYKYYKKICCESCRKLNT